MPKMIKKTNVLTVVVEQHRFCDVCGAEINHSLACLNAECMYCRKDLCEKCIGHEEETGADYRDVWCKRCWDIGTSYRPRIEGLDKEAETLYDEWKSRCIEGKTNERG